MQTQASSEHLDKPDVITFKVDKALAEAMRGIANRSKFIRESILQALDNSCPFCAGTGVLTASQKKHWQLFLRDHELKECRACHGKHPVCKTTSKKGASTKEQT